MQSGEDYNRELRKWAELIRSGMLPSHIRKPQEALVLAIKGKELGWKPMQAFAALHVINGKVEMSAESMLGLIYGMHPTATIEVVEHTDQICKVSAKRHPEDVPHEVEFTMEDAKRAGLTRNPTWTKYPKSMLWARAISRVRRWKFPDTAAGVYVEGEIGGQPTATVVQIPDDELAEVVSNGPAIEGEIDGSE